MSKLSDNFLALTTKYSDPATARYHILPVPYEGTVSYAKGTAEGPSAIVAASQKVEWFDEELLAEFYKAGVATLPAVPCCPNGEEQMRCVYEAARAPVQAGKFLLSLGGEHSITPALVKAVAEKHGEISVLQIDAHSDLRDSYKPGGSHSHACAMRRVLEITPRLAQVGIRSFSFEEYQACPDRVASFITAWMVATDPTWIDRALALLGEKVYITIDIDGLDPAEGPGTGTPEPGGLRWAEVTALLRSVCRQRQVVAADIVEVRPLPPSNVTEFLAARLACKIIAYTQPEIAVRSS